MASKCSASLGLFLALNLLLCNLAFSNYNYPYQYQEPQDDEPQYQSQYEEPQDDTPQYQSQYDKPLYRPQYQPQYQPHGYGKCKSLDLDVCVDVLNGVIHVQNGGKRRQCCSLIKDLVSLDATICLCTIIPVNLLDIFMLNVHVDLSVLINNQCRPYGYQFPSGIYC